MQRDCLCTARSMKCKDSRISCPMMWRTCTNCAANGVPVSSRSWSAAIERESSRAKSLQI